MEGAVGLGEIWCHKEKELAVYYGCWAGGSGTRLGGREPQHPQMLWMDSVASQFAGVHVPGLFRIASQILTRTLVRGLGSWGALLTPFHLLRSWQGGSWTPC